MASGEKGMVVGRVTPITQEKNADLVAMLTKAAGECETVTLEVERRATIGLWVATLRLWDGFGVLRIEHVGKGFTVARALELLEENANGRR